MANLQATTFTDLTLPRGTTAERPATPATGMVRYNTSFNLLEFFGDDLLECFGYFFFDTFFVF